MPSENPTNLTHTSLFRRIISCFHPVNHTLRSTNRDGNTAAPPRPVDKLLQPQYSEESLLASALDNSEYCSICLIEFTGGVAMKVLPRCGHVFHKECIDQWLPSRSLNCPVCRDQAIDEKLIRKPVGNQVFLDPGAVFALYNFSIMYPTAVI